MYPSICITHAEHIPERKATMLRLRESLPDNILAPFHIETHRGPHWEWAEKGWEWSVKQTVDHCLFLQDDVLCMPELLDVVSAMTQAVPDAIIAMHSPHPGASKGCFQGNHPWYTTADSLVGTGYIMPRWLLERFLQWRETQVLDKRSITEDTMLTVFAMSEGRKIYHPVPSPIDHDISVETSNDGGTRLGRDDGGAFLKPMLPWWKLLEQTNGAWDRSQLTTVGFWQPIQPVPHVGRTRRGNHWMLVTHLKDALPLRAYAVEHDLTTMAPKGM